MAEFTIDKFSYGGNTYKLQDNVSGYAIEKSLTITRTYTSGVGYTYTVDKTYQELQDEFLDTGDFIANVILNGQSTAIPYRGICIYDEINDEYLVAVCENRIGDDGIQGLGLFYGVIVDYHDNQRNAFNTYKWIPTENTINDVKINNVSIVSNKIADIVTNTAYNASTNKVATMTDINNAMTVVTFTPDGTNNNLIISVQNPSSISNGNEVSY